MEVKGSFQLIFSLSHCLHTKQVLLLQLLISRFLLIGWWKEKGKWRLLPGPAPHLKKKKWMKSLRTSFSHLGSKLLSPKLVPRSPFSNPSVLLKVSFPPHTPPPTVSKGKGVLLNLKTCTTSLQRRCHRWTEKTDLKCLTFPHPWFTSRGT